MSLFKHVPILNNLDSTENWQQLEGLLEKWGLKTTTGDVASESLAANRGPEAFKSLTALYKNSWENFEAGRKGEYRKNGNHVELRGVIKEGKTKTIAFTLPVGYRPKESKLFIVYAGGSTAYIMVTPGGEVEPVNIGGEVKTSLALDPIVFTVE